MANLKDIRLRINSIKSTQQTTKAMKMVSAAKLRKAQDAIIRLRPYANKMKELLHNLLLGQQEIDSPFVKTREIKKVVLVVVTSNKGLCGAFNSAIYKLVQSTIQQKYSELHKQGNVQLLCVGKKGYEYFKKSHSLIGENHDLFTKISFAQTADLAEMLMQGFKEGKWDKVEVVYNEFKNVATQIRKVETFLPLEVPKNEKVNPVDYIFEPNKEEILSELIPKILKVQFYRCILESNASEHGARMVAMDSATENASQLISQLRLVYNKERQAAITKEILEIVGGAEALASN
jgi:F-type H+-transporting ATPase subunit gamma